MNSLCEYGCSGEATYQFGNGKCCCSDDWHRCPAQRERNGLRKVQEFQDPVRKENHRSSVLKSWSVPGRAEKNAIGMRRFLENESLEHRAIRIRRHRERCGTEEARKRSSEAISKCWNKDSYRRNHSKGMRRALSDPELRKRIGLSIRRFYKNNPGYVSGSRNSMYGKKHSKEARLKQSIKGVERFRDPNFLARFYKAKEATPNKQESILVSFLDEILPGRYEYTGDYSLWIGGKNPDFTDKERKRIIEHFGTWYHGEKMSGVPREVEESMRINHFTEYGYETLVIWEDELADLSLLKQKIMDFERGCNV